MEKEFDDKISYLTELYQKLKKEYIELNEEILYQDFGLFTPQYVFSNIEEYKNKLVDLRKQQKELIKSSKAAKCEIDWKVNGSSLEGKKMITENIKQSLRTFNIECETCIDKVKFYNYDNMRNRIIKSYKTINKLNETNHISISQDYLNLKLTELELSYSYQQKKKELKEEERMIREQKKEEEKVLKEIEARRRELEKEKIHYNNALKHLDEQLLVEKSETRKEFLLERKEELDKNLIDIETAMKDLDYREANHRAGYVYIISNIGAFGENVYKIGMTRRLFPEERIAELSGASVPFKFDIHAMIFSEDAPALENKLHKAFEDKKLNLINSRKEFFKVTLEEIKQVIQENFDKTVEYNDIPEAEQFRESELLRKQIMD